MKIKKTKLKEVWVGDILVNDVGNRCRVLLVMYDVFLISRWDRFNEASAWFTIKEANMYKWKVDNNKIKKRKSK